MEQYLVALLILCASVGSLGTTNSSQQQNSSSTSKDLCEKAVMSNGFPGIPGSNGMPGMPGMPGPQGPQGREGAKGQTGDKGTQGQMGSKGEKGAQGPNGNDGQPGMMGIKGERGNEGTNGNNGPPGTMGNKGEPGLVGAPGSKGDKGEKGSPAGPVPQTNWKQCVWKKEDPADYAKITECPFNKLQNDTALKVSFQGVMRVYNSGTRCNRWYFKFNNQECTGPTTIEAVVLNGWPSSIEKPNLQHHRSFEGYCENIPQGAVAVELWVGQCGSFTLGDAYTGWNSVSRILIEEVSRAQS